MLDDAHMGNVVTTSGTLVGWEEMAALTWQHGLIIISGHYNDRSSNFITNCNQCVTQAQAHVIAMRVWPLPFVMLRIVVGSVTHPLTSKVRGISKVGSQLLPTQASI